MLVFNRWWVVIGAVLIQLALGSFYAWSVFTQLLTDPAGPYAFSASQTAWIFSAGLATFAVVMLFAGRWQARFGPRPVVLAGGAVLGLGYMLAGLFGSSFLPQLLFIGVIGGFGIGMAYVVPIAVGVKWFPDKKGLITGLAVAGFGFGATIWVKLAGAWFGGLLNTTHWFGLPGVQSVFFIYGLLFLTLVVLGGLVMVNPPEGYKPAGWTPPEPRHAATSGGTEFTTRAMLRTPQFYALWAVFMFSALAGLMVIYSIKLFGIDALSYHGVAGASAVAGTAMAWYAIFNGLGRIVWGSLSDRLGRKASIVVMAAAQGLVMLTVYHGFVVFGSELGFIVAASLIGFNFGGNFALFPATTADYFGNAGVGGNYPWIFTAYGVAGILGPQMAGLFKDAAGVGAGPQLWMAPFIIAAAVCFAGAVIMLMVQPPRRAGIVRQPKTPEAPRMLHAA